MTDLRSGIYLVKNTKGELPSNFPLGKALALKKGDIRAGKLDDLNTLIMPGGASSRIAKELNGEGNQILKKFIEKGGVYLGICGGAYYVASEVEFRYKTRPLEREHELSLHPKVKGPRGESFKEEISYGHFVDIKKDGEIKPCIAFYHGGADYKSLDTSSLENFEVLFRYAVDDSPAVFCFKHGKGLVVLSSIHIDIPFERISQNEEIREEYEKGVELIGTDINKRIKKHLRSLKN